MMKVNNSSKREEHKILFTQFGVNEPTSGGESNSPFHYDQRETLHKKFPNKGYKK